MRAIAFVAAGLWLLGQSAWAQPVAAPPPLKGRDDAAVNAWAREHLDVEGWVYYGFSQPNESLVIWYVADQPIAGSKYPIVQDWVRSESAFDPGSRLARTETDCQNRRARDLEQILYRGNNLRGSIARTESTPDAPWMAVKPGTMADALMQRVCRDGR